MQRANSSGTASSTAPVTPARLSRALSSGAVETSVSATAAAAAPAPVPVVQGESPRGDQASGGYSGGGVEGDAGRAVSLDEKQKSIIEAREAAEAGAGLVKVCSVLCVRFDKERWRIRRGQYIDSLIGGINWRSLIRYVLLRVNGVFLWWLESPG